MLVPRLRAALRADRRRVAGKRRRIPDTLRPEIHTWVAGVTRSGPLSPFREEGIRKELLLRRSGSRSRSRRRRRRLLVSGGGLLAGGRLLVALFGDGLHVELRGA